MKYVPEYLVHFDSLTEIASDYGLRLEKKVNFHEYYDQKMNNPELNPWEAGAHSRLFDGMVKRSMPELDEESLAQQWEIVGLYCVFVFRKESGPHPAQRVRRPANFGNWKLVREIMDQKSWE